MAKFEIKNRFSGNVMRTVEAESLASAVVPLAKSGADLSGANLSGADLRWADLGGADLRRANLSVADLSGVYLGGANLSRADLRWANLSVADLSRADLRWANLSGADLRRANLSDIQVSWSSHDLIAEILKRAAGEDVDRLKFAGLVLLCRQFCWSEFERLNDPQFEWALGVLAEWVKPDDVLPGVFRSFLNRRKAAEKSAEQSAAV